MRSPCFAYLKQLSNSSSSKSSRNGKAKRALPKMTNGEDERNCVYFSICHARSLRINSPHKAYSSLWFSVIYSSRPQDALLDIEQRAALGCTSLCRPGLPSTPFPVGHPAVVQSNLYNTVGNKLTPSHARNYSVEKKFCNSGRSGSYENLFKIKGIAPPGLQQGQSRIPQGGLPRRNEMPRGHAASSRPAGRPDGHSVSVLILMQQPRRIKGRPRRPRFTSIHPSSLISFFQAFRALRRIASQLSFSMGNGTDRSGPFDSGGRGGDLDQPLGNFSKLPSILTGWTRCVRSGGQVKNPKPSG